MDKKTFEERQGILKRHWTAEGYANYRNSSRYWESRFLVDDLTPDEKYEATREMIKAWDREDAQKVLTQEALPL